MLYDIGLQPLVAPEQGCQHARTRMRADCRTEHINLNLNARQLFAQQTPQLFRVLRAIAVGNDDGLLVGIFDVFDGQAGQLFNGLMTAALFADGHQLASIVNIQNGLNANQTAQHSLGLAQAAAAVQVIEVVDRTLKYRDI